MAISESKKVTIKAGSLAFIGNFFGKFISIPVGIFVASSLGPSGYGLLAIIIVIIQYISYLNLGMLSNISREVPIAYGKNNVHEVNNIYNTIFTNYFITTTIGIVVLWVIYLFQPNFSAQLSSLHFLIITFIIITANVESFYYSYIKGEGLFIIYGQFELVSKTIIPLATVVLVYFFNLTGVLLSLIFTHLLGFGFIISRIKRPRLIFKINIPKTKELFSTGIFMFINKIIDGVYISVGIIMASRFLTDADTGILSFALGFASIKKIPFARIFAVTVKRKMAVEGGRFGTSNYNQYSRFFGSTYVIYLLLLTMILGVFIIFYSILVNIFLEKFQPAIPLVLILFFALNFYNARFFLNSYINVTNQLYKRSIILVVGVVICIVLGYATIKMGFGVTGLSISIAASMIIISIQTIYIIYKQVFSNPSKKYIFLLKLFIISGLSTSLLYLFIDFKFIPYEYNYHSFVQMGYAILDFLLKTVVFSTLVFLLYIGLFRSDKVYHEIKMLTYFTLSKTISAIKVKFTTFRRSTNKIC